MSCGIHSNREHVGICGDCGIQLCSECMNRYSPPSCPNCMLTWGQTIKKNLIQKGVISAIGFVLGILWVTSMPSSGGFSGVISSILIVLMCAGVPWGWNALTKITPQVFLFLPLVGWVAYFVIKFFIAFFIGAFCAPFQILKIVKGIKLSETAKTVDFE